MKTYQFTFLCQCEGMPFVELQFKIKKEHLTQKEATGIFESTYAGKFNFYEFVSIKEIKE